MVLWKLILAYDGTHFHGWQIQPNLPTIQGTLAQAIFHVTRESVLPQGSGRTDTGVHALGQVATFSLHAPIPPPNLLRALNRALPPSIRILSAQHAPQLSPQPFHARHSALRKTYEYRIFPRINPNQASPSQPEQICPPTLAPYVWDCPWPISLPLARHTAAQILGTHDFTSFAAADPDLTTRTTDHSTEPTNLRTIYNSCWHTESNLLLYRVTGSGFLHHMVRNLVGTFVGLAAGRLHPESIPHILASHNRSMAGPTAPARGLFLVSVEYPPSQDGPA